MPSCNLPGDALAGISSFMQSASADIPAEQTKPVGRDFSLQNILGENPEDVQHPDTKLNGAQATGWDEESTERPLAEGFCIECEGKHPHSLLVTMLIYSRPARTDLVRNLFRRVLRGLLRSSAQKRDTKTPYI